MKSHWESSHEGSFPSSSSRSFVNRLRSVVEGERGGGGEGEEEGEESKEESAGESADETAAPPSKRAKIEVRDESFTIAEE